MGYLHEEKGFAHRDLKLGNLLLDKNLNIILIDFGYATFSNSETDEYYGSKPYMAPEIIERLNYNAEKADIFSFGVLIFTLVMGIYPFHKDEFEGYGEHYEMIKEGKEKKYWKIYEDKYHGINLSTEFKDLVIQMFNSDPKKRPSIE